MFSRPLSGASDSGDSSSRSIQLSSRLRSALRFSRQAARASEEAGGGEPEPASSEYRPILEWFASGNHVAISDDMPQVEYAKALSAVRGLERLAEKHLEPASPEEAVVAMELVLEGLHQNSILSRERGEGATTAYKDMLKSMLSGFAAED